MTGHYPQCEAQTLDHFLISGSSDAVVINTTLLHLTERQKQLLASHPRIFPAYTGFRQYSDDFTFSSDVLSLDGEF